MAQVNIRVDDNVKARAESACLEMGLNMTTAINIFLVKLGNEMRIPFEVSVDPFYSPENQRALEESIRQIESGKGKQRDLIEVDDE